VPNNVYSLPYSPFSPSARNSNFDTFISSMKELAKQNGINWSIRLDANGLALPGDAWDLRSIANDGRPKTAVLRTFSLFSEGLDAMALRDRGSPRRADGPLPKEWQEFLKAVALEYLLVRKKSISFISAATAAIRFLATVADKEPWKVTVEDVQLAIELSDARQSSKGTSIVLQSVMTTVVDGMHLADACPLMGLVKRSRNDPSRHSKLHHAQNKLSKTLAERKAEQKLPEHQAFWELVRIVFTETPRTLNDALRFALVKVLLFTGLRVGEAALLPQDWRRTRTYLDDKGRPAGEHGGLSEALMLRHFAEKQGTNALYESTQFVPDIFRDELERTLRQVEVMTAPLRATLKAQYETGRLFPMYPPGQLVDAVEMYVRLTGNPMWAKKPSVEALACVERYRKSWEPADLAPLNGHLRNSSDLSAAVSRYFSPENRALGLILRDAQGQLDTGRGVRGKFLLISEVEAFVRNAVPTKVPDLATFTLDSGSKAAPWEMLFLLPKRAVGAGRGETVLNPTMTFSVGVADEVLLMVALGDDSRAAQSLFMIYGLTDEDRKLKIKSHSLRHLQNTELFRLGIADTIITKRFNRRSVAQSYEYDHRSLAEEMDQLELPDAWAEFLGDSKAVTVAKLAQAGRAEGPIVREFRRIQAEEGDKAALAFLAVEADGFHATPYGYCLNSFTVDPCPKHLECFSGCRHLSATNLPENRRNIIQMRGKLQAALEAAQARAANSIGRDNQIAHATERIKGLEQLLSTEAGEQVFPDGPDLSKLGQRRSVLSGT
jgi:hypothetical protein